MGWVGTMTQCSLWLWSPSPSVTHMPLLMTWQNSVPSTIAHKWLVGCGGAGEYAGGGGEGDGGGGGGGLGGRVVGV